MLTRDVFSIVYLIVISYLVFLLDLFVDLIKS